MANPNTYAVKSGDIDQVDINLVFTVGASGAIGTVTRSRECNATTPVTHTGTGAYRVNLKEAWVALLNHNVNNKQVTFSTAGACFATLTTDAAATTGLVTFTFRKLTDGTAVDPADGDKVRITLTLQKTAP